MLPWALCTVSGNAGRGRIASRCFMSGTPSVAFPSGKWNATEGVPHRQLPAHAIAEALAQPLAGRVAEVVVPEVEAGQMIERGRRAQGLRSRVGDLVVACGGARMQRKAACGVSFGYNLARSAATAEDS